MADSRTAKTKTDWTSWRNKPYAASRSDGAQTRAAAWDSFTDFVRLHRGWITSPPGGRTATLEVEKGSALPAKLAQLGYVVTELANGSRLIGSAPTLAEEVLKRRGREVSEPAAEFTMAVDRYEVTLPWAAPPAPMRRRTGP